MAGRRRGPITNRRHLARQQRENLQTRGLMIASAIIIGTVLLLVVYGLIVSQFIEPGQPVATVNAQEITTREFRSRVRYERLLLVEQWNQMANFMVSFGATDPNSVSFIVSQMNQIEFQLDPTTVGRSVLNDLVADRLIREEAAARGITVTEDEVDAEIDELFGYFGGAQPPTPTASPTIAATSTLTPLQMTLTAPTATATLTETNTITDTAGITDTTGITDTSGITDTAGISETGTITDSATPEVTATPVITITPTLAPTPTPKSLESYQEDFEGYLEALDRLSISEAELRYIVESQIYREKLLEALTADVNTVQDQVWARHVLVATEAEALDVIARLEAGEAFATLAAELSTDTASAGNGGDLGWFGIGQMVADFEKVAFNLQVGQISEPTQSQFGWHVIQVLGHEERPLTPAEYADLQQTVFEEWLSTQRLLADVQLFDIWAERVPNTPTYPPGGAQALLQQLQVPQP